MRPHVKIILSTLASLLLLGLIVLVAIPFMIDLNDFKAEIENVVEQNTGRKLTIEGDVELSIFPWLGITTGKMTLDNNADFNEQPFAQISEGQIKVKLLPLLFKKLEVSEIVLKGLSLNLQKNTQGVSNWDDLLALIQNKENEKHNPLTLLEIAGVLIKNAQINWNDQQNGKYIQIKEFNLNSERLVFNHPIEMEFDFTAYNPLTKFTEIVDFSAHLTIAEALDIFNFKKIKLKTQTEATIFPSGKLIASAEGDVKIDLSRKMLKFSPLHTKIDALTISTSSAISWAAQPVTFKGLVHIPNFDVAEFMQQQLQIKLPKMIDETALSWMSADFNLDASENYAKLQNLEVQLDETILKGNAQIRDFSNPEISLKANLDKVNLDRYLPPPAMNTSQNWQNSQLDQVGEHVSLFPIEALRKLNLNTQIAIDELKVNNMTMQGIKLQLNGKNGQIQSLQSVDRFYQGAYQSKIVLDTTANLPVLRLQQQLSHVQIAPLLNAVQGESQWSGLIDLNAKLEAVGNSRAAIKSSLNGRLSFLGKNMLIRGIDLQKIVDNGKILLANTDFSNRNPKEKTFFSKVTATAIISNGFLNNNDLLAHANKAKVSGMGLVNLVSKQIDYKIIALLLKENLTSSPAKVVNNLPVFINIGGTFAEPAYQVDLAAMGVSL